MAINQTAAPHVALSRQLNVMHTQDVTNMPARCMAKNGTSPPADALPVRTLASSCSKYSIAFDICLQHSSELSLSVHAYNILISTLNCCDLLACC